MLRYPKGPRPDPAQSVQNAVTFNNLAVHYAKNQDFDNAVQSLQKAVASDPKMQEAYINLSIVSEMMKNNTDSIAAARKAVALDGKNVRARMQLCDISLVSKLFVESAACFEELQKLTGPDELTMLKYGIALSQTDDADRALPILQKVVRAMPNYVAGWNALGTVYLKRKCTGMRPTRFRRRFRSPRIRDSFGTTWRSRSLRTKTSFRQ